LTRDAQLQPPPQRLPVSQPHPARHEVRIDVVDPFDLPDWLGTEPVTWHATSPLGASPHVTGVLETADGRHHDLDLLAVDAAYPVPVCPEAERRFAHQAWQYGEVILLAVDGRTCAGVPGREFDANLACEVLRRVARSVAAEAGTFTLSISL
jgi:hypothetical protein